MKSTIAIDRAGRVVFPKWVRDKLALRCGARLRIEVIGDKMEITPEPEGKIKLVKKGKFRVFSGIKEPFNAVEAIEAAREADEARRLAYRSK